jgi:hypothetical protein
MNGATMAARDWSWAGGVDNYRALRALAERHDRHFFQEADRLCREAGIAGYNGCCLHNALLDERTRRPTGC